MRMAPIANTAPRWTLFPCIIAVFLLAVTRRSLPRFARLHLIGVRRHGFARLAQHRVVNGAGERLGPLVAPKQRKDHKKVEEIIDGKESGRDHMAPSRRLRAHIAEERRTD